MGKIILFLCYVTCMLSSAKGVKNSKHDKENLLTWEEKRTTSSGEKTNDLDKSGTHKRGLFLTPISTNKHQGYPSGYDHSGSGFSNYGASGSGIGYGASGHGGFHSSGYDEGSYLPSTYHQPSSVYGPPSGGGYGSIGHSGQGAHGGGGHSILALKGLLAGIALLGAAAALSTNPVLLQLGVLNGRRRRRAIMWQDVKTVDKFSDVYPQNPLLRPV